MIDQNELLTIELRNRGNEDVGRLLSALREADAALREADAALREADAALREADAALRAH